MSGVDTRNISRDSLFLLADVRLDRADREYRVKVRNLSAGGMMAEGNVPVVPGTQLQINLRNIGWVDGGVAWVQENRFGIAFAEEINPKMVRATPGASPVENNAHFQFLQAHTAKVTAPVKPGRLRKI